MRIAVCCCILLTLICTALPVIGQQTCGGVFFDDVKVVNDGKTLLFEDFNSGKLDGWRIVRPQVITVPLSQEPVNHCLYMNRLNDINTGNNHIIKCDNVGNLEVSAFVYLPSPEEQWGWSHNTGNGRAST